MGLDGFIIGNVKVSKRNEIIDEDKLNHELDDIWSLQIKLGNWRKCHALHEWVTRNYGFEHLDGYAEMEWKGLDKLRSICKDKEKAMEEIPKSDSYHEEWWEEELEEAIKTIDKIEEFKDDFSHFSYESSW